MPQRPPGHILKYATPIALLAWFAVLIGAFWGLDWRWIPTTLLASVAFLLGASYAETQLERRATRQRLAELLNSPDAWKTTVLRPGLADTVLGKDETR
jgi:kynureninase